MNIELIGAMVEIISAANKTDKAQKGKVIDETKNTITIETKKGNKKFIKNTITLKVKTREEMIIDGKTITKRSYDRIKG
ncbi:ribonuclease P protein subunit [Candidatus Woesearchaeota archaeon]|nr:ribonuclease P protein subunit [Candidatus Woesearchaeota archaeon]